MNLYRYLIKNRTGMRMILLLLFLAIPMQVFTEPSEYGEKQLVYAFEFLRFRAGQGEKTVLEVFSQIATDNLQFVKFKDGFYASYDLAITLYDQNESEVKSANIIDSVKVQTFDEIDLLRPPRLIRVAFLVESGQYQARVKITDLETLKEWKFEKTIHISDFGFSDIQLSDLQIATTITPTDEKNSLVKNNMKVIPNVQRILGPQSNVLYVYSELYNLQLSEANPENRFIAIYTIHNKKGKEVKSMKLRYIKPGNTCVLNVEIPVDGLNEGLYQLKLTVTDLDNEQTVSQSTTFYVVNPDSKLLQKG
ncbi:MAG: hypothetical protein ACE5HX_03010 [bacterium]